MVVKSSVSLISKNQLSPRHRLNVYILQPQILIQCVILPCPPPAAIGYSSSGSAPTLPADQIDWVFSVVLLNTMKSLLTRILYIVIYDYNKEICNGCRIKHSSQRQHVCIFGIHDFFLETHFEAFKKRPGTQRVTPPLSIYWNLTTWQLWSI